MKAVEPILVITWGNPSRGDDALGPLIYDRLYQDNLPNVDVITDFQLQIEHSTDIDNRSLIIFVDASVSASEPYELTRIFPEQDDSFTSHAMSPQALLSVSEQVNSSELPESQLLAIRGYDFELGHKMTKKANKNVDLAYNALLGLIEHKNKKEKKFIRTY